jgi:hypothetical protein
MPSRKSETYSPITGSKQVAGARPATGAVQVGAVHPIRICKISTTNKLLRSKIREDNITKPIHEQKHNCDWQRGQAANDIFVIISQVNECDIILVKRVLQRKMSALVRVLHCIPPLGTPSSATVQKLPLTSVTLLHTVACVCCLRLYCGKLTLHDIHKAY